MNKIHHKRVNNINNNNNNYYNHYKYNFFKKNYSKNNNIIKQNNMNNFNEEWSNNNYYNNNNFDNHNQYNDYSYPHSIKKKKYTKYYNNNNKNNFDDKIIDDNMSKSTNDSKQKNELKIKINMKNNELKELIIYKEEDIESIVNIFCSENNIDEKLVTPLCNKINQSLNEINFVNNNLELNKDDVMLLNNAKKIVQNI